MIRYYFRQLGKSERGAAMVEFAIIALLLFTLIFGIIEFGWILNGYITLNGAAKEGARLAIVGEKNANVIKAIENYAVIFPKGNINVEVALAERRGEETIVTVNGKLPLLIGFIPITNDPNGLEISVTAIMLQENYSVN